MDFYSKQKQFLLEEYQDNSGKVNLPDPPSNLGFGGTGMMS